MGKSTKLFTSESVTEGHPDKMADQIRDFIETVRTAERVADTAGVLDEHECRYEANN